MSELQVQEQEPKPKYYVIRMDDEGQRPRKPYSQRNHAYRAAESLARKNPGVDFIVVKHKTTLNFQA